MHQAIAPKVRVGVLALFRSRSSTSRIAPVIRQEPFPSLVLAVWCRSLEWEDGLHPLRLSGR